MFALQMNPNCKVATKHQVCLIGSPPFQCVPVRAAPQNTLVGDIRTGSEPPDCFDPAGAIEIAPS